MNKPFPYQITNIRTNTRKPGFIYATIVDDKNERCVSATLEYCVKWIERKVDELKQEAVSHISN